MYICILCIHIYIHTYVYMNQIVICNDMKYHMYNMIYST